MRRRSGRPYGFLQALHDGPRAGCYRAGMPYRARTALLAACLLAVGAPLAAAPAAHVERPEQLSLATPAFASIGGLWCGAGLLHEFSLELVQNLQQVKGRLVRKQRVRELTARVEGTRVQVDPQRDHTMELQASGDELRIVAASGVLALATGQSFTRATGGSCAR